METKVCCMGANHAGQLLTHSAITVGGGSVCFDPEGESKDRGAFVKRDEKGRGYGVSVEKCQVKRYNKWQ